VPAITRRPSRLYALRDGYLFMGLGLAIVTWPLLAQAPSLPLDQGVTLCMLTAMSVLALLGLRHPIRLLPVLLLETMWKLVWLGLVALPQALGGGLDSATGQTLTSCSLVLVILLVIPWPHVWRTYVGFPSDPRR
jgi:hypothetical protein